MCWNLFITDEVWGLFLDVQAQMAQKEADEMAERLEKCEKENQSIKDEMNKAIEEVTIPLKTCSRHSWVLVFWI